MIKTVILKAKIIETPRLISNRECRLVVKMSEILCYGIKNNPEQLINFGDYRKRLTLRIPYENTSVVNSALEHTVGDIVEIKVKDEPVPGRMKVIYIQGRTIPDDITDFWAFVRNCPKK